VVHASLLTLQEGSTVITIINISWRDTIEKEVLGKSFWKYNLPDNTHRSSKQSTTRSCLLSHHFSIQKNNMADHDAGSDGGAGEVPEKNGILSTMFSSCAPDPRGSVHRAWGISLLFVVLYFILSIFESKFRVAVVVV
jgi:hypothetical protein